MSHANACLTPKGRLKLARCVVEDGCVNDGRKLTPWNPPGDTGSVFRRRRHCCAKPPSDHHSQGDRHAVARSASRRST